MLLRLPIIVLLGVMAVGLPFLIMNKIISKEILSLETDIIRYSEIVDKNSMLKAENSKMEYFIDRVKNIENSRTKASTILTKINSYVPKEITFMNLSFSDSGSINISGESDTYSAIPEFLANLEMSEEFYNAKITYINPIEKTIEVSEKSKLDNNISTKTSLLPIAMTGNFNIWEKIMLAADDSKENSFINNTLSDSNNGEENSNTDSKNNEFNSSPNNNTTSTNNSENNSSIKSTNTIIKYSFSILIEGVSKDGSKAKETE